MGTTEPVAARRPPPVGPGTLAGAAPVVQRPRSARDGARGARQRRRRIHPHPGRSLRARRAQTVEGQGPDRARSRPARRALRRRRRHALGAGHRRSSRRHRGSLVGRILASPTLPGPLVDEVGRAPGRLRVALCSRRPTGPTSIPGARPRPSVRQRCSQGSGTRWTRPRRPRCSIPACSKAHGRSGRRRGAGGRCWQARTGTVIGEADVEPTTWAAVTAACGQRPELLTWLGRLQLLACAITGWWSESGMDVLVTPTTAAPPTALGDYLRGYEAGRGSAFTRPFNVTGQPALSLPLGWPDDGLPPWRPAGGRPRPRGPAGAPRRSSRPRRGPGAARPQRRARHRAASDPMPEAAHDAGHGREQTGAWTPAIEC